LLHCWSAYPNLENLDVALLLDVEEGDSVGVVEREHPGGTRVRHLVAVGGWKLLSHCVLQVLDLDVAEVGLLLDVQEGDNADQQHPCCCWGARTCREIFLQVLNDERVRFIEDGKPVNGDPDAGQAAGVGAAGRTGRRLYER